MTDTHTQTRKTHPEKCFITSTKIWLAQQKFSFKYGSMEMGQSRTFLGRKSSENYNYAESNIFIFKVGNICFSHNILTICLIN